MPLQVVLFAKVIALRGRHDRDDGFFHENKVPLSANPRSYLLVAGKSLQRCQIVAFYQFVEIKQCARIELGQQAGFIGAYRFAAQ